MTEGLSVRGVTKSFGPTLALGGVDLEAEAGEVHAILGENGAGKSTLMGILGGIATADAGTLTLGGAPYAPRSPREAQTAGVAMVHQELSLCPHLSVEENIVLGREPSRFGLVDRGAQRELAAKALEAAAGPERARAIALAAPVGGLPLADRQLVEIARALAEPNVRVLILDEPTSSLGREEVLVLFERVRAMKARGLTVLYISHFLEEVKEIADRFTVLRDGKTVRTGNVKDAAVADLVTAMAGREVSQLFPRSARAVGEVVLACEDVAGDRYPVRASFALRRGEVLGIAGLVGSGRTELLRVLFGLDPLVRGTLRAFGRAGAATPAERIAQGFGLLSEDRKGEGLALPLSLADNLTLSKLGAFVRASWQRRVARDWAARLSIVHRDVADPVLSLSGGNQQKVALGRLLYQDAAVLLLDQPGRGIDVAAKASVYESIDALAVSGKAVLLVSDDLAELCGTCDRIAVMRRGVLGEARPASAWTPTTLLAEAVGAEAAELAS